MPSDRAMSGRVPCASAPSGRAPNDPPLRVNGHRGYAPNDRATSGRVPRVSVQRGREHAPRARFCFRNYRVRELRQEPKWL